jgi:hypothetical protein
LENDGENEENTQDETLNALDLNALEANTSLLEEVVKDEFQSQSSQKEDTQVGTSKKNQPIN